MATLRQASARLATMRRRVGNEQAILERVSTRYLPPADAPPDRRE
jgi:hypothetical protein